MVTQPEFSGLRPGPSRIEGTGLFTTRPFRAGALLVPYVGLEVCGSPDALPPGKRPYLFLLEDGRVLDGSPAWNLARYINHSCEPNAGVVTDGVSLRVEALIDLARGEEITISYHYKPLEALDQPCRCGRRGCLGYMVSPVWRGEFLKLKSRLARGRRLRGKNSIAPPVGRS